MVATYPVFIDDRPARELKVESLNDTIKPGDLCEVEVDGERELCLVVRVGVGISVRRLPMFKPQDCPLLS